MIYDGQIPLGDVLLDPNRSEHRRLHMQMQENLRLDATLQRQLERRAEAAEISIEECLQQALRQFLNRSGGGHSLYLSAPINALLEGIYREDTRIEDILRLGMRNRAHDREPTAPPTPRGGLARYPGLSDRGFYPQCCPGSGRSREMTSRPQPFRTPASMSAKLRLNPPMLGCPAPCPQR